MSSILTAYTLVLTVAGIGLLAITDKSVIAEAIANTFGQR